MQTQNTPQIDSTQTDSETASVTANASVRGLDSSPKAVSTSLEDDRPQTDPQTLDPENLDLHTPENPIVLLEQSRNRRPTGFFKQQKSIWPVLILGMFLVLGLVGLRAFKMLSRESTLEQQETIAPTALPVRAVRTRQDRIQGWVSNPDSQVWALRGKHLTFEASGEVTYLTRIENRYLREGDRVSQGQLLAKVDDREYLAHIRVAEADVRVAQQQKDQAMASLAQANANLEKAKADLELAISELRRRQELFDRGAISASERDTYANQVSSAKASVKVAEQDIRAMQDGVASAQSSIEAATAQLTNAQIALEDTELVSPIEGIVAYLNIREGDYWTTQRLQTTGNYQDIIDSVPILVVDPTELEVVMELTAEEGSRVQPGQTVYLLLDEDATQAFITGLNRQTLVDVAKARGTVFAVNPAVTPGGRGVQVRVQVTKGLSELRIGERVQAWIEVQANTNAVVLPPGAVVYRDRQPYIFVVQDTDSEQTATPTVEQRQIELGIEGLAAIEVRSGLEAGELVVTEGRNRLVNGTPVEIVEIQE